MAHAYVTDPRSVTCSPEGSPDSSKTKEAWQNSENNLSSARFIKEREAICLPNVPIGTGQQSFIARLLWDPENCSHSLQSLVVSFPELTSGNRRGWAIIKGWLKGRICTEGTYIEY